ncbi:hypothetical protein ALI22I_33950 [Saccharothrix sp. ALI-22-I]|uniref:phage tail tube protein n=1 Tax=Saccharothrix sp. ALI-22-I TaxID=1933778 RepID=UPI00097CAB5F|nr:hypothetical protein [Saccharothrix sp. ALI-22-I]ONI83499.1 hypothetical protein ALI22I_33950 [Saccharothrix sp. ALI-22-I]
MALDDGATLVIDTGNYLLAPTGTEMPSDLTSPAAPWENVGHTSLEELLSITSEGGEATVLATLQNKTLRTRYSARTERMTFVLQQFDIKGLRLFYGANAPLLANGTLGVPTDPKPTVSAILIVFVDGDNTFAFYAPKAEIYRADDLSLSDTESLAGMPIGITPLVHGTNNWTYAVTPLTSTPASVVATGATAGSPGAFTPIGAALPASLTALRAASITASPATAWATGQYVVLGDSTQAHWDGNSWESGAAA